MNQVDPVIKQRMVRLMALAGLSGLGYAVLMWLSWKFDSNVSSQDRPTLTMLVLFGCEFVGYFAALWLAVRLPPSRWLVGGILSAACLFRGVLLPSVPMHEIDIYRYIWDGAVLADGVSPYRYSPQQVVEAANDPAEIHDPTLQQLVDLQATSGSLNESLNAIHYGHFPSPYPLVSQAVFALSAQLTPDTATSQTRLVTMKSLLVLFDLATLVVVLLLLREVGMHLGWSISYGWCPLAMKEFANGGHLDSIAIFLTTLAVWLLVKTWQAATLPRWLGAALTGSVLALAIGAKLYPVVLVPLFAAVWLRRSGWLSVVTGMATMAIVSAVLLDSLFGLEPQPPAPPPSQAVAEPTIPGELSTPTASSPQVTVKSDEGIQAFLNQWEMNDLVFMFVLENLRAQNEIAPEYRPWFVVTSDDWSQTIVTRWAQFKQKFSSANDPLAEPLTSAQMKAASFALARVITGGGFGLVACLLAWLAAGRDEPRAWCRAAMLTLAWFWLTCPTQNPWYWCWVLPLLPFARYRTWYVVAAATMLYYLRFWYSAHYPEEVVLGTPYYGPYFFYFVVAWIEFAPVLLMLAAEWFWRRKRSDLPKSVQS